MYNLLHFNTKELNPLVYIWNIHSSIYYLTKININLASNLLEENVQMKCLVSPMIPPNNVRRVNCGQYHCMKTTLCLWSFILPIKWPCNCSSLLRGDAIDLASSFLTMLLFHLGRWCQPWVWWGPHGPWTAYETPLSTPCSYFWQERWGEHFMTIMQFAASIVSA